MEIEASPSITTSRLDLGFGAVIVTNTYLVCVNYSVEACL